MVHHTHRGVHHTIIADPHKTNKKELKMTITDIPTYIARTHKYSPRKAGEINTKERHETLKHNHTYKKLPKREFIRAEEPPHVENHWYISNQIISFEYTEKKVRMSSGKLSKRDLPILNLLLNDA